MAQELIRSAAFRIPGSAQKARLVANLLRGAHALGALTELKFMPQKAARQIEKVVKSAVSNAEENFGMDPEELYIQSITVDEGPTRKWRRFGARGRLKPILRRSSHITVLLSSHEKNEEAGT